MSYSKTIIVGRLGKDPETRFTPEGKAITTFSVAVDVHGKEKTTAWYRVTTWEGLAETCQKFLSKGKLVLVEGTLTADPATGSPRIWKGSDGESKASFEVSAREVKFLSPKDEGSSQDEY